jgi:AraC-like DNA-binding protein
MAKLETHWWLDHGAQSMLVGNVQAHKYGPHLHDTYTIAVMTSGTARIQRGNRQWTWGAGQVFVGNAYEVHQGGDKLPIITYDVIYPSVELIAEAFRYAHNRIPRFSNPVIDCVDLARALTNVIAGARQGGNVSSIQNDLVHILRAYAWSFELAELDPRYTTPVVLACRLMQTAVNEGDELADLPSQLGYSRYHFIRLFHRVTGLAPRAYSRQLRLAKAQRLLRAGTSIAEVAADCSFADQAHLTREFKRAFGATPGKILRDIALPRVAAYE